MVTGFKPRKIKILHIFGRMDRAGAEMQMVDLLRLLDPERFQFDFCALSGAPGALDEEIRRLGGVVHLLRLDWGFPKRFRRLLRANNYTAVHSHVHLFSGYILRLARAEQAPQRIAQFHTTSDGKGNGPWRRFRNRILQRLVHTHATDIVGVNRAVLDETFGPGWKNGIHFRTIYNSVDLRAFDAPADRIGVRREFGIPDDATLVIHVGRMDPVKNHERLIRIFDRFAARVPDARLLLAGRRMDPVDARLDELVKALGVAGRIIRAGARADVPRLLKASDIMLFPSHREGLPCAVLEAAAAGTPVLASELRGVTEVAAHLPLVRTMLLSHSDEEWAFQAMLLRASETERRASRTAFARSPFSAQAACRCFEQLYSRDEMISSEALRAKGSSR
jgi:glycosyltransferase involved in cell wall biosynthesis